MTRYACFYKPIPPSLQEGGFWVGGVAGGEATRHTPHFFRPLRHLVRVAE